MGNNTVWCDNVDFDDIGVHLNRIRSRLSNWCMSHNCVLRDSNGKFRDLICKTTERDGEKRLGHDAFDTLFMVKFGEATFPTTN